MRSSPPSLLALLALLALTLACRTPAPPPAPAVDAPGPSVEPMPPLTLPWAGDEHGWLPVAPGRAARLPLAPRPLRFDLPDPDGTRTAVVVQVARLAPGAALLRAPDAWRPRLAAATRLAALSLGVAPDTIAVRAAVPDRLDRGWLAALAAATLAALTGAPLRGDTALLGDLASDGTLRPIPDLASRVEAAARAGYRRIGVPAAQLDDQAVAALGQRLGATVVPVADLRSGHRLLTGALLPAPDAAEATLPAGADPAVAALTERSRLELGRTWPEVVVAADGVGVSDATRDAALRALEEAGRAERARQRGDAYAALWWLGRARLAAHQVAPAAATPTPVQDVPGAPATVAEALAALPQPPEPGAPGAAELAGLLADLERAAAAGSPAATAPAALPGPRLQAVAAADLELAGRLVAAPPAILPPSPPAALARADDLLAAAVDDGRAPTSRLALAVARGRARDAHAAALATLGHAPAAPAFWLRTGDELAPDAPAEAIAAYRRATRAAELAIRLIRHRAAPPADPPSPSAPPARP